MFPLHEVLYVLRYWHSELSRCIAKYMTWNLLNIIYYRLIFRSIVAAYLLDVYYLPVQVSSRFSLSYICIDTNTQKKTHTHRTVYILKLLCNWFKVTLLNVGVCLALFDVVTWRYCLISFGVVWRSCIMVLHLIVWRCLTLLEIIAWRSFTLYEVVASRFSTLIFLVIILTFSLLFEIAVWRSLLMFMLDNLCRYFT